MKENRKAVRVDADGVVEIKNIESGIETSGFLKDLSISGVGFFSYDKFEINEHVKLRLKIEESEVFLKGIVVFASYSDDNFSRYGIEIEEIDNDNFNILKEYVTKEIKVIWGEKIKKYSNAFSKK